MSKSIKATALRAIAISAASLFAMSPVSANHQWATYHWERNGVLNLRIGDNLSSEWSDAFVTAIDDWNKSSDLELAIVDGMTNPKNCKAVNGTVQVCNSRYGNTGWLGIAQIWLSGEHITQGITKLNDTYFASGTYNNPAWRALVTCQEIGHDFGLSHQDEDFYNANLDTCMDYTNNPASNQHPNGHDYEMLGAVTMYGHTDFSGEEPPADPPKPGNGRGRPSDVNEAIGGNSAAEWGRAIRFNVNGKPDTFAKSLPSGTRLITHVFWLPEPKNKK